MLLPRTTIHSGGVLSPSNRSQAWRKYAEVIEEFRAAKRAGLKIVFILRLYLSHDEERNKFLWHGAGAWG